MEPLTTTTFSRSRSDRIGQVIQRYIDQEELAGVVGLVAHRGEVRYLESFGTLARGRPARMGTDSIFRIWSMTKPITYVALMTLYEKGHFQLPDPVHRFIPEFRHLEVFQKATQSGIELEPLERDVTIRDLLTHTGGLTYHILENSHVEQMYRDASVSTDKPLADFVADLLKLPLAFQPGSQYRYSFGVDVLARLVEIISGRTFDVFLNEELFQPLGMKDTGFQVPPAKTDRLADQYGSIDFLTPDLTFTNWYEKAEGTDFNRIDDPPHALDVAQPPVARGGHGLFSTAMDYYRFCQMLLNGGDLEGAQILSPKTVELMTTNHLPPDMLPYEIGGMYSPGYGFGLGFRVLMDLGQCGTLGSPGEYGWAGAAGTYFWIDPQEDMIGIEMTQFQPADYHNIAADFRVLAYQCLVAP